MRRPAFWLLLAALSLFCAVVTVRVFPRAFSIVALDITMDRDQALARARDVMARQDLGPAGYRQAASFVLDGEAQTFIELEGGGKEAFTAMLGSGLYSAYTWQVRHYAEGEPRETTIRFTPDGRLYGFVETLRKDAPGAALQASAARAIAEDAAPRWKVDLTRFTLVEQGQERRVGGRIDHTITYERTDVSAGAGRYRLRLVVSGDRLTEVTHFVRVPEAFTRRYANMRSANDAIGLGGAVGMMLLYVIGGIGIGLFFMLRARWVLWRRAVAWGLAVGAMQALAMVNQLPLAWMTYDTALPRSTFLAQQAALVLATLIGLSTFVALSFMAAETLTRRAFGDHPQLWHAWSRRSSGDDETASPGASMQILGRTVAGYLLVAVFLAYDVMLYYVANTRLGWWSPSEALLHPDVLATYAPWLSAIANSFQAGFWEEALFRAVPLAGAALIGDRFGQRRLFIGVALVVQALVFGAGHAQYPAQPAYARPLELFLPSIGFGLLYLRYGLLPGIVLHYAFDVVLFAIPILLSDAPGVWIQKALIAVFVLVPLWIVLVRRAQAGRWTELSPADRNAAWTPPVVAERETTVEPPAAAIGAGARMAWLAIGATALLVLVVVAANPRSPRTRLTATRADADAATRRALAERGVTVDRHWRVMPRPLDGSNGPHAFVASTAGEARRRELVGTYLPAPGWSVRVATFEGDVADRAEEWGILLSADGRVLRVRHVVPEGRAGASLDEPTARALAVKSLAERFGLDAARGQAREVSARPAKLPARTDWTFTFADTTVKALPQGEPRIEVAIAGDEVVGARPYVFVPEAWERTQRAAGARDVIIRIADVLILGGLLGGAAVMAVMAWSRRQYAPALFVSGAALMLLLAGARLVNTWPSLLAGAPTEVPLRLALLGILGTGAVAVAVQSSLVGLVLGAVPYRLVRAARLPRPHAAQLGIAVGIFGAAAAAVAAAVSGPPWRPASVEAAAALVPTLQAAVEPSIRVLMATAVLLATLLAADELTMGWRRRRLLGALPLVLLGIAAAGVPATTSVGGWLIGAAALCAALVLAYVAVLRFDLSMVPLAVGAMTSAVTLAQGIARAYPGALAGSVAGALAALATGWWLFTAVRKARDRAAPERAHATVATSPEVVS